MLPKIIIAGFKDFSRLANQILKEIHIPIPVNIETVGLPLEIFDKSNVDLQTHFEPATILIAGDRSALLLEEKLNNVVIPVKISGFDLLEIIDRHCSSKVVRILNFKEELVQVQKVSHLLNVEIIQHQFRDLVQFHEVVEKLKEAGVTEVIGGSFVCDQMPKFGIKGISYYSKRSMIEAIHTAINFIKIYRKEMEQAALFKTIVNMNKSGIISTDRENKINVVSPSAEKLLSLKQEKILKKNIHSVIKEFQNFSTTNNSIFFKWNNKQLVAEITPVNIANDKVGNIIVVEDIQEIQKSEMKIREKINEKPLRAQYTFNDIMGSSPVIEQTKKIAKKYSQVDSAILLQGESGTGKELFAQAIHNESNRRDGPFVAINCAALPESLLDSELFGYEEGAFTGAKKGGKKGLFELAHKGTIFLDEISELPLHLQSKLLRVLQEKEVMKIGGNKFIPVDIRVITATNRDLKECIKEKTFREDLYYRISVLPVYIPPLRERIEDIGQIVEHYFCKNEEIKVTHKLLNVLFSYHWPGNVRELINVLERFQAICHGEELHEDKAVEYMKQALYTANAKIYKLANAEYDQLNLKELEKRTIQLALHAAEGNKDTTAELLGISRTTLWRKLKEYGLDVK